MGLPLYDIGAIKVVVVQDILVWVVPEEGARCCIVLVGSWDQNLGPLKLVNKLLWVKTRWRLNYSPIGRWWLSSRIDFLIKMSEEVCREA